MRRGGKGDAIPLIAFHNAPLFKAGFFTLSYFNETGRCFNKKDEKRKGLNRIYSGQVCLAQRARYAGKTSTAPIETIER
jgi:hypothetical protein